MVEFDGNESVSQRLRFYSSAFEYIKTNPLLGCGIGNWRILSIKYDSEDIFSYVVPYFAHNDFIEVFAEIGLFGLISYILFFYFIFMVNFKNYILWLKKQANYSHVLLMFFIISYLIDANLNFPIDRPAIQSTFLYYLAILLINTNKKDKNEI